MKTRVPAKLDPPRRILVRGVNWLGDAVLTTPALLRLREHFPGAHITLFCPDKLKELWWQHPAISEIIAFESRAAAWVTGRVLRTGKFDLALVLPNSPRSAMEVFFARIPARIGYARPWRNFFLTQTVAPRAGAVPMHKRTEAEIKGLIAGRPAARVPYPASAHQIHEYLHLTAALGANPAALAPQLTVTPEEVAAVKKKFGLEALSRPVFGLNPGAEYGPAKRWPAEKFSAAAKEIQTRTNCLWLIFGGKNDVTPATRIGQGIEHQNLAGKTSLRELMALLKLCRVLLTNDTGPMHVAAALGTPVVVPFGSTSPELTGPVSADGVRHQIIKSDAPCSPCFLRECPIDFRCLNGISSGQVAATVLQAVG
ncbi:MAG: lipopolysaccharide heptosyltransferase II [Verrucomicrobiae bacterium]|nr:lipopolysaccharide heptosyltransferase II [Verrucomicrobiae bacterium]